MKSDPSSSGSRGSFGSVIGENDKRRPAAVEAGIFACNFVETLGNEVNLFPIPLARGRTSS